MFHDAGPLDCGVCCPPAMFSSLAFDFSVELIEQHTGIRPPASPPVAPEFVFSSEWPLVPMTAHHDPCGALPMDE